MPQEYCILNIEDKNVKLIEYFYKFVKFENIKYKAIETTLSYEPTHYLSISKASLLSISR